MLKACLLKYAVIPALLMTSLPVYAGGEVVFSCNVRGGKQVKIVKSGDIYTYSFGKKGTPELVFQNTKKRVVFSSYGYDGVGRYMSRDLEMGNGAYTYSVASYVDRMGESQELQGQVSAYKGNKLLTEMQCIGGPEGSL